MIESRNSVMGTQLAYQDGAVSAYAETYERGSVVKGRRLALAHRYAEDGVTLLCPACGTASIRRIWESSKTIDVAADAGFLAAVLTDPSNHGVEPWELEADFPVVSLCLRCGHWVVDQAVDTEDLRYVVQVAGRLQSFDTPNDLPVEALVRHLGIGGVRLRDVSPARFEQLVAEFLRSEWHPCDVQHVGRGGGPGDGGIDLVLLHDSDREYLVQIKHHPLLLTDERERLEGVQAIRELNGVLFREGKARGIFVTAARGYTRGVWREREVSQRSVADSELILLDRLDLNNWINRTASAQFPWRAWMRPGIVRQPPWEREDFNGGTRPLDFG